MYSTVRKQKQEAGFFLPGPGIESFESDSDTFTIVSVTLQDWEEMLGGKDAQLFQRKD